MLTTQVQVLLYLGDIQIVSCSVFIPVPAIVVKSHQTLEAIRPYLPLSLTYSASSSAADAAVVAPVAAIEPPLDPLCFSSSSSTSLPSTSLILSPSSSPPTTASSPTSTPVPSCSSPSCSQKGHRHSSSSSSSLSISHSQAHSSALTISPDSSIPATTCIKISLRPTPSFKIVNPKCPHQQQRNRNLRHLKQQQQQQQQQDLHLQQQQQLLREEQELKELQQRQQRQKSSSPPAGYRSHSHSHPHSRSQSPSEPSRSHHSSHRSSHRRHSHRCTLSSMTSLSTRPQTSVLFTYPYASSTSSTSPKIVQVTGSFNDWKRTDPLTLNQALDRFELEVTVYLKEGSDEKQKILFKFVLDDQEWVTDASQERERDQAGNLNNILFLDPAKATVTNPTNTHRSEEPAAIQLESTPKTEVVATAATAERAESEEEKLARLKQEEEDDATIRQLGGGMWGSPFFAVNDPANLPEHFVDSAAPVAIGESEEQEQDKHEDEKKNLPSPPAQQPAVKKTEPITVAVEQPAVAASAPVVAAVVSAPAAEEEEEDEDDATIRRLGGGMWGTPFFKVNDPAALPEHFVEALGATSVASSTATAPAKPEEVIIDREEEELSEGEVIRDDISGTMEGTLMETVVDTTEDTVIEDAQGNFLEESITTSRQDSIQGEVQEKVTEVIETIEDIEPADPIVSVPPIPTPTSSTVAVAEDSIASDRHDPHVTTTESEVISVGADGVETTVLEETITFVEGPEVDSSSLHSLTTAIKPVQEGESVLVEAVPELHVQTPPVETPSPPSHPTTLTGSAGDAKPFVDVSTIATTTNSAASASNVSPCSTARTSLHGDRHEGDGDYGVAYLQGQQPFPSGDATPAADLSVDFDSQEPPTLKPDVPGKSTANTAPAATTTTSMDKTEKRKSFWKKLKKVLT